MLEFAAEWLVLVMTPTGRQSGVRDSELIFQSHHFARSGSEWNAFVSSIGF